MIGVEWAEPPHAKDVTIERSERGLSGPIESWSAATMISVGLLASVLLTRLLSTVPSFEEAKNRMRNRLVNSTHGGRGR